MTDKVIGIRIRRFAFFFDVILLIDHISTLLYEHRLHRSARSIVDVSAGNGLDSLIGHSGIMYQHLLNLTYASTSTFNLNIINVPDVRSKPLAVTLYKLLCELQGCYI